MSEKRVPRIRERLSCAVAVSLVVVLAACGGNTRGAQPSPTNNVSPTMTSTPGGPGTPTSSPATGKPKPKPSVSVKPSGTATAGPSATLDLACVRRGVDTQGLTVHTQPGGPAGFNTSYSDGSSNVDGSSNYTSGSGGGFADASGTWRFTWVVPANAPAGKAIAHVVTAEGPLNIPFQVVLQNATCPA